MESPDFLGQTLDGKYHIERELGRGGMGTVYLANHLGTERPVAVKIIAPQYMERGEFVERFRREARAAGRLRHPNVVNVTDFGFADTRQGQVAYLVMEYLDGCTLGEILDEEKNLPIAWTLDILEQVCSAVHEAHQQGIIHRDLKPDNIWLEPNQRGGYTVKVLDFGIAKLEEFDDPVAVDVSAEPFRPVSPTLVSGAKTTFGGIDGATAVGAGNETQIPGASNRTGSGEGSKTFSRDVTEAGTLHLSPVGTEDRTAIFDDGDISADVRDNAGTRLLEEDRETPKTADKSTTLSRSLAQRHSSAELTRVGAVLGTPLYMSPEQCRGERLDPRSDIYSLSVIAYQMLAGRPPFEGDFKDVMEAHKSLEPAPLKVKGVRKKLQAVIHNGLSKQLDLRPQTAESFASELRSNSDGTFGLLRRALVIYGEHLQKFLGLTVLLLLPAGILTLLTVGVQFARITGSISESTATLLRGVSSLLVTAVTFFCTYLIVATITWMVTQYLAVPLRPLRIRPSFRQARRKWKRLIGTGIMTTTLTFIIGVLTCGLGFLFTSVAWALVSPVLMMEDLKGFAALKRSWKLVRRSLTTTIGAVFIMFLVPFLTAGFLSVVLTLAAKGIYPNTPTQRNGPAVEKTAADGGPEKRDDEVNINFRNGNLEVSTGEKAAEGGETKMRRDIRQAVLDSAIQLVLWPLQIFFVSFSAIIVSLLYIKTRLAGGESMNDLIERFEDDGRPKRKWQERVKARLIQSGRVSSNPSR
jgi:serine/threonine protein kinase